MKPFGGLEEKIMSSLRTHLPLRSNGREGGGVYGDGSPSGHESRGQPQCLGSAFWHFLRAWVEGYGPPASPPISLRSLAPPSCTCGICAFVFINPSRHSAGRRLSYEKEAPPTSAPSSTHDTQIFFQICTAVLSSWECTVQISQGESSTKVHRTIGENQFKGTHKSDTH